MQVWSIWSVMATGDNCIVRFIDAIRGKGRRESQPRHCPPVPQWTEEIDGTKHCVDWWPQRSPIGDTYLSPRLKHYTENTMNAKQPSKVPCKEHVSSPLNPPSTTAQHVNSLNVSWALALHTNAASFQTTYSTPEMDRVIKSNSLLKS